LNWDRLRSAVRASSAFPGAFEHKTINRTHRELRKRTKYRFPTEEPIAFHYSDGGIVNNQPLNKAIEVVNELPVTDSGYNSERVFLVVDPSPPKAESIGENEYGVSGLFHETKLCIRICFCWKKSIGVYAGRIPLFLLWLMSGIPEEFRPNRFRL